MALTLYGYRYSVYTRIARMALSVRGLAYHTHELDPFAEVPDPVLAQVSPFGRVPVLEHDGFRLCETAAITRYLARAFPGPALIPEDPGAEARMVQAIAVIDAYGYWPMVRQVFSHAVFRPLIGAAPEPGRVAEGLEAARPVLGLLDALAAEKRGLHAGAITLADLHLAPMIGYFAMAPEGRALLAEYPALTGWWDDLSRHPAYLATDPGLATLRVGA
jgi:glutathione S-transferase